MKSAGAFKGIILIVCLFSLIFGGEISPLQAETKGKTLPMGEMISRGQVTFQVRENIWKNAEAASLPIFPGMIVKTEKGTAAISLADRNQIEVGPNSLVVFERKDQIRLSKGTLDFRIAPRNGLTLCAGNLLVVGSPGLQAGKGTASLSGSEEALGSLTVHSHGGVTIQGNRGQLTILNRERVVLAAVSPKNSLTIPAAIAGGNGKGGKSPAQLAQVGEEEESGPGKETREPGGAAKPEKSGGWSGTTWLGIGAGVVVVGGLAALAGGGGGGGGGGGSPPPVCP